MRNARALAAGLILFAAALLRLPPAALGQGQTVVGTGIVSQGSALPANCNPATGDISQKVFYMTSGATPGLYYCSALNTWTGAGGGLTINTSNNVLPKRSSATAFADSALTDDGTSVISTEPFKAPNGSGANPSYSFTNGTQLGFWRADALTIDVTSNGLNVVTMNGVELTVQAGMLIGFSGSGLNSGAGEDIGLSRASAGVVNVNDGTGNNINGVVQAKKYNTG